MNHTLKYAMHPSQQNHCHILQNFPPLGVTGPTESTIKDMLPAMHEFFVDEVPTQPTNEKQPPCPIQLYCPKRLVHNDYKIENTVVVISVLYDYKRNRKHSRKTPIFYLCTVLFGNICRRSRKSRE
jgi:hypothetical protein